jgi:hypothetical protein
MHEHAVGCFEDRNARTTIGLLAPPAVGKQFGPGVLKYVIANREGARILEELRLMNITRASLFPGLDGFAQSFRTELIEESTDEKRVRLEAEDRD